MLQLRSLLLVLVGLLLSANAVLAANYAVGTCKPGLTSFTSISAAVISVPPGSTILVCPGTYAEQITISQPLTLKGIASGNSSDVVIAVPVASGLTGGTDAFGFTVAALVTVTAGPVNISNVTVDGTGANVSENWLVGILYLDGSSGTVNEATFRQLYCSTCLYGSVGMWGEGSSGEAITIENSSFHNIDETSVLVLGDFLATVKGNSIEAGVEGVEWSNSGGTVTGNVIHGGSAGGIVMGGGGTISGNTITGAPFGVQESSGNSKFSVTSNKISNAFTGIYVRDSGNTYKSNTITNVGTGIEFNCHAPTVASNTINDATTGFDQVPAAFSGTNNFNSVVTVETGGCGSTPIKAATESPSARRFPVPPSLK